MRNNDNWVELFLSGFSSDQELIELVIGDLNEERYQHIANKSQLSTNILYLYHVFRTVLHLTGQWFQLASKASLFARLAIVLIVSSLCVLVTIETYNFYLSLAKFGMSLLGHSGGQEPLIINWNLIVSKTLYTGMLITFIGGLILSAFPRSVPMVSTMLLSIILVISSILIPIFSNSMWPLWSFLTMALSTLIFSQLGGFIGLVVKGFIDNRVLKNLT